MKRMEDFYGFSLLWIPKPPAGEHAFFFGKWSSPLRGVAVGKM